MVGDGFTMTVTGGPALRRALTRLAAATAGQLLLNATIAGALPIVNQIKVNAHKVTGTLARSYHVGGFTSRTPDYQSGEGYGDIGGARSSHDEAEVFVGTDLEYARREELGFIGADSLGRRYNFEGHPHVRPAFDTKRGEAQDEVAAALGDLLRKAVRG